MTTSDTPPPKSETPETDAFYSALPIDKDWCFVALQLLEHARQLERENARLRECLRFFSSVIKCGEPWTTRCQQEYDKVT